VSDLNQGMVMIPHNVPVTLYVCASCEHPLTGDLLESEAFPAGDHLSGHRIADPRVAQGTYAINYNATLFILHPDDVPGTALHPDRRRRNGCCGLDGQHGPNLVCAGCGAEVATKESDCWTDNLVALIAAAVVGRAQSQS
jgi:DNA-directed RNA polymerase subunit RPC12/RpoP